MIYLLEDDDSIRKLVLYGLDSQGFQAKGLHFPRNSGVPWTQNFQNLYCLTLCCRKRMD